MVAVEEGRAMRALALLQLPLTVCCYMEFVFTMAQLMGNLDLDASTMDKLVVFWSCLPFSVGGAYLGRA